MNSSRIEALSRQPWLRACAVAFAVGALLSVAGCAGYQAYREGQSDLTDGHTEPGLIKLREAMDSDPDNSEFRRTYFTRREHAINDLLREADLALDLGDFATARQDFDKIRRLEPTNPRVVPALDRVATAERHGRVLDGAAAAAKSGNLDSAISATRQVLSESPNDRRAKPFLRQLLRQQADATGKELGIYPKLAAAYRVPVSLSFTNATLLQVFEAVKQASGLNYMIERDVNPEVHITLSVTDKPVEDIVRLLLATNQLARRVLDGDTLLIYPDTPAKQAEYREMVVRSFYLANADATKVAAVVRTIAKAKDIVVDEKLNMLMVRDSEDVVRLAEKVIASQDLAEPEVMLELEVMEVSVNRLLDMGIQWPTSVSASVIGTDGIAGQLRLNELRKGVRNAGMIKLDTSDPLVSGQFKSETGDATLLANPRVRVRNRNSAKILIGERVPVITTTTTANVGTSQSISYLDVGLKLDIEPTVSLDDEVAMKIALEVSNITQTITLAGGTQAYRLGTRNTSTTLQVHDGETNILAGLIQRDRSHSNTGLPGLNELPLLNRLFGMAEDSDTRTEIVLLITPHIVRALDVPGIGQQEFLSGTESAVGAGPIQLGQASGAPRAATLGQPPYPAVPSGPPPGMSGRQIQPAGTSQPPSPEGFARSALPSSDAASRPTPGLIAPPLVPSPPGTP